MKYLNAFFLTVFALGSVAHADNLYISYTDLGGPTDAMLNTEATGEIGDMVTAHVWYENDTSDQEFTAGGIVLDIFSDNAAVTSFQSAVSDDPGINFLTFPSGETRWLDNMGEGGNVFQPTVTTDKLTRFGGFTVTGGPGIRNSNRNLDTDNFTDSGYQDGNGFYMGSFTFLVTGEGTTTFSAAPYDSAIDTNATENNNPGGAGSVVSSGSEIALNYGSATFTVTAIPEPTTAGLLAIGLVGLVARRRR